MTEYFKNLDVSRTNLQKLGFPEEVINELYAVFKDGNLLTNDEMRSVIEQCFDTRISSSQIRSTIYDMLSDDKFGNSNSPETIAGWLFLDEKNDVVERLTDEFVERYGKKSARLTHIYDFLRNHPYYSNKVIPNLNFEWIKENRIGVIKDIKNFKLKLKIKQILEKSYNTEDGKALCDYIDEIKNYDILMRLFDIFKKNDVKEIEKIKQRKLEQKENSSQSVVQRTLVTSEKLIEEAEKELKKIKKGFEDRIIESLGDCEYSRKLIDYVNEFSCKYMPKFYVPVEYLVSKTEKDIASTFSSEKYFGIIKIVTIKIISFETVLKRLGIINNQYEVELDENVDDLLDEVNEKISRGEDVSVSLEQIKNNVEVLIEKMGKKDVISADGTEELKNAELYEKLREISSKIGDAIDETKIAKLRILNFSLPGMPSISEIINVTEITLEDIENSIGMPPEETALVKKH